MKINIRRHAAIILAFVTIASILAISINPIQVYAGTVTAK